MKSLFLTAVCAVSFLAAAPIQVYTNGLAGAGFAFEIDSEQTFGDLMEKVHELCPTPEGFCFAGVYGTDKVESLFNKKICEVIPKGSVKMDLTLVSVREAKVSLRGMMFAKPLEFSFPEDMECATLARILIAMTQSEHAITKYPDIEIQIRAHGPKMRLPEDGTLSELMTRLDLNPGYVLKLFAFAVPNSGLRLFLARIIPNSA